MTEYKQFFSKYGIETETKGKHCTMAFPCNHQPRYCFQCGRYEELSEFPKITAEIREKLEELVINRYGDIAYVNCYTTDINNTLKEYFYSCKCDGQYESYDGRLILEQYTYSESGKTRTEALLNLLCKLDLDKAKIKEIVES